MTDKPKETQPPVDDDTPCPCLRCILNRSYDTWMEGQPNHSVQQQEVIEMAVKFLGDVVSGMPMYDHIRPIRIMITGETNGEPDAAPPVH
jgi:hypothetical protein